MNATFTSELSPDFFTYSNMFNGSIAIDSMLEQVLIATDSVRSAWIPKQIILESAPMLFHNMEWLLLRVAPANAVGKFRVAYRRVQ